MNLLSSSTANMRHFWVTILQITCPNLWIPTQLCLSISLNNSKTSVKVIQLIRIKLSWEPTSLFLASKIKNLLCNLDNLRMYNLLPTRGSRFPPRMKLCISINKLCRTLMIFQSQKSRKWKGIKLMQQCMKKAPQSNFLQENKGLLEEIQICLQNLNNRKNKTQMKKKSPSAN